MAIQFLRGSYSSAGSTVLASGQPFYDTSTGYLYVGGGHLVLLPQ